MAKRKKGEPIDGENTTPETSQAEVALKRSQKKTKHEVEKKNSVLKELKIEYVSVESVHANSYNPNRQSEHDHELLLRSIEEDGFTQPVICLKEGRIIVDGEHRWRAAKTLGYTQIPVVFVDMTPEQARISTLRHNRARGSEDIELSAQVLRDLQAMGALEWASDSLMMSDAEINKLIEDIPAPELLAAEEYSTSWEPATPESGEQIAVEGKEISNSGGISHISSATGKAVEDIRVQEKRLNEAKSEEERVMIRKDTSIYRISAIFSAEEADLVRTVLGDKQAERILELCKEKYATMPKDTKVTQ